MRRKEITVSIWYYVVVDMTVPFSHFFSASRAMAVPLERQVERQGASSVTSRVHVRGKVLWRRVFRHWPGVRYLSSSHPVAMHQASYLIIRYQIGGKTFFVGRRRDEKGEHVPRNVHDILDGLGLDHRGSHHVDRQRSG